MEVRRSWRNTLSDDKPLLGKLAETTLYGMFIKNSAACFAVFCRKDHQLPVDDGSAATINIIYGVAAFGLGTCWVWGDSAPYADAIRDLLHVPEEYRLIALVPAGYPAETPQPRKKALADVSFWNTYR